MTSRLTLWEEGDQIETWHTDGQGRQHLKPAVWGKNITKNKQCIRWYQMMNSDQGRKISLNKTIHIVEKLMNRFLVISLIVSK